MQPSRLTRMIALGCVATTLVGCSTAVPTGTTPGPTEGFRWRTTTTVKRTTTTSTTTTAAPTTTTTSTTTTAAPATTTTTVPSDAQRFPQMCASARAVATVNPPRFSASSIINQPAACLPQHPESDRWAATWFVNANKPGRDDPAYRGDINIAFDAYSNPIYYTDDATTLIKVYLASWGYTSNLGDPAVIPWNPNWEPASGNDMEMIILDRDSGREWSLWGVQKINWTSCFTLENLLKGFQAGTDLCVANAIVGKNPDGTYADAVNSTGFSHVNTRGLGKMLDMAMLPTLDEIEKGSINHVVNMETYGTMFGPACTSSQIGTAAQGVDCGYAVAPANRLEWVNGPATNCGSAGQQNTAADRVKTVPEGMRFALDMTDAEIDAWLDRRGYTGAKRRTARIFAVAYRDYGWMISDTTCWDSFSAVEGVANPDARNRWSKLGITNPTTDGKTLMDGLITSADQVRVVAPTSPTPIVAAR